MLSTFRRAVSALLEFQTRRLFKRKPFLVVAVSGAVGKTTTKLAIATVLSQKYRVLVQHGSFNDEIGLPLACFGLDLPRRIYNPFIWIIRLLQMERILHLTPRFDVLVIEVGTDAPGEIPHALTYLRPDIGVVTAVVPEHMKYFENLDSVAAEELALVGSSPRVVVGRDDIPSKYRHKYVDKHPDHFYYGSGEPADYVFAVESASPIEGTSGVMLKHDHQAISALSLKLYGRHVAKAAAAAFAVGDLLGLTNAEMKRGLEKVVPAAGRMNPLPGLDGSTIIDDTYNSSPEALRAAIQALLDWPVSGRRIALIGSMNELGPDSRRYHEEAGSTASAVDLLVTVGEMANSVLGPAALRAGLDPTCYKAADTPYAAGEFLKLMLRSGDVLLAKGSQNGVFTEEALGVLLANPSDSRKLVRQSPFWMRIKAKQFKDTQL